MNSLTISFSGKTSILQSSFFPEILLDANSSYSCGLLDFTSYNSIPNIVENKNNRFTFIQSVNGKKSKEKTISLPTGAYEALEILTYLKEQLAVDKITLTYEISAITSKVRITFDKEIEWLGGLVLNILGFQNNDKSKKKIFKSKVGYWSDQIVKITNIDVIRIECDIVSGSYINGKHCNTIHQFSHCKNLVGYKFIEQPIHIIYLPIKQNRLQSIQISIVDQDDNLIDFRGEQISCRIHIRKDIDNDNRVNLL